MYREQIPKCADQILWNLLFMKLAEQTINTSHQMLCPCLAAILTSPGKYQETEAWSHYWQWIRRGIVLMLISISTPVIFAGLIVHHWLLTVKLPLRVWLNWRGAGPGTPGMMQQSDVSWQPIRGQGPGHVISPDQSEAGWQHLPGEV